MAEPTDITDDSLFFLESVPSNALTTASQTPDSTKKMWDRLHDMRQQWEEREYESDKNRREDGEDLLSIIKRFRASIFLNKLQKQVDDLKALRTMR